jgi:hypothetical protein
MSNRHLLILWALLVSLPSFVNGQNVEVRGRVVERDSAKGLAGVSLRFAGTNHEAVTDSAGRFLFRAVHPGSYTLELRRLGYADHNEVVSVPATAALRLEIRMDATPIGLPSVTVTAISNEERSRRAEGTASRLLTFEVIQTAAQQGRKIEDLIRTSGFGLRVRDGDFVADGDVAQRILCIEAAARGRASLQGGGSTFQGAGSGGGGRYPVCNMVPVFLDGIKLGNPGAYLRGAPLDNFEQIEWLNVIAAGTRFGVLSENKGVLVLRTRTGKR